MKKKITKISIIVIILFAIVGLCKINMINTKSLSSLGTNEDEYERVKSELGEEFSSFITDKSFIKIYCEDEKNIILRVGEYDFVIDSDFDLKTITKKAADKIQDYTKEVVEIIEEKLADENNGQ